MPHVEKTRDYRTVDTAISAARKKARAAHGGRNFYAYRNKSGRWSVTQFLPLLRTTIDPHQRYLVVEPDGTITWEVN